MLSYTISAQTKQSGEWLRTVFLKESKTFFGRGVKANIKVVSEDPVVVFMSLKLPFDKQLGVLAGQKTAMKFFEEQMHTYLKKNGLSKSSYKLEVTV